MQSSGFIDYLKPKFFPRGGISLFALGTFLISVVFAFAAWRILPHPKWWIWLVVMTGLIVLSYVLKLRFSRNMLQPSGVNQSWISIVSFDTATGLMWVSAALMINGNGPQLFLILLSVLFCGAALLSAVNLHSFKLSSFAAIGVGLLILAQTLLGNQNLLALLCLTSWVCVMALAWSLNRGFLGRQTLMFEKEMLLQNIEDKIHELDQLRVKEAASRREAEIANQAKSRFLAHSSHDLRQPLHAMGLLLETIPEKGMNKRARQITDRVKQSLDSLSGLFDSLLDVALLDTGQVELNNTVFCADEVLSQIVQDYEELARGQNVSLRYVPTGVFIETDRVILHRMVQNLVSNAIKNSNGARVLVGVRRRPQAVAIAVYDTGKGIAPANQKRIFEEFTKLDEGVSDDVMPGLGLGLSIVRRLARIIEAGIVVNSRLGAGSVFSIEGLRRAAIPKAKFNKKASLASKASVADIRICIVDDDIEVLKATRRIVEKWGFDVESFTETPDAHISQPDIILCDYQLEGELTGIDVIREIRMKFGAETPAILITGNTSGKVSKRAQIEKLPVLYKPVKPAQLRSLLLTMVPKTR